MSRRTEGSSHETHPLSLFQNRLKLLCEPFNKPGHHKIAPQSSPHFTNRGRILKLPWRPDNELEAMSEEQRSREINAAARALMAVRMHYKALDDLKAAQVAHDTVSDDEIPPPPPSLPDPLAIEAAVESSDATSAYVVSLKERMNAHLSGEDDNEKHKLIRRQKIAAVRAARFRSLRIERKWRLFKNYLLNRCAEGEERTACELERLQQQRETAAMAVEDVVATRQRLVSGFVREWVASAVWWARAKLEASTLAVTQAQRHRHSPMSPSDITTVLHLTSVLQPVDQALMLSDSLKSILAEKPVHVTVHTVSVSDSTDTISAAVASADIVFISGVLPAEPAVNAIVSLLQHRIDASKQTVVIGSGEFGFRVACQFVGGNCALTAARCNPVHYRVSSVIASDTRSTVPGPSSASFEHLRAAFAPLLFKRAAPPKLPLFAANQPENDEGKRVAGPVTMRGPVRITKFDLDHDTARSSTRTPTGARTAMFGGRSVAVTPQDQHRPVPSPRVPSRSSVADARRGSVMSEESVQDWRESPVVIRRQSVSKWSVTIPMRCQPISVHLPPSCVPIVMAESHPVVFVDSAAIMNCVVVGAACELWTPACVLELMAAEFMAHDRAPTIARDSFREESIRLSLQKLEQCLAQTIVDSVEVSRLPPHTTPSIPSGGSEPTFPVMFEQKSVRSVDQNAGGVPLEVRSVQSSLGRCSVVQFLSEPSVAAPPTLSKAQPPTLVADLIRDSRRRVQSVMATGESLRICATMSPSTRAPQPQAWDHLFAIDDDAARGDASAVPTQNDDTQCDGSAILRKRLYSPRPPTAPTRRVPSASRPGSARKVSAQNHGHVLRPNTAVPTKPPAKVKPSLSPRPTSSRSHKYENLARELLKDVGFVSGMDRLETDRLSSSQHPISLLVAGGLDNPVLRGIEPVQPQIAWRASERDDVMLSQSAKRSQRVPLSQLPSAF